MNRISMAGLLACSLPAICFSQPTPNLTGYVTPENAVTFQVRPVPADRAGLAGYLGVQVAVKAGALQVVEVQPASPADKAGLKKADVIRKLEGQVVTRADQFREQLLGRSPGETVTLTIQRDGKTLPAKAILSAVSRPMQLGRERVTLGVRVADAKEGEEGTLVEGVTPNSPAAQVGLKVGDVLLRVEGNIVRRSRELADALAERKPGDVLNLVIRRGDKEVEAKATLTIDRTEGTPSRTTQAGPPPSQLWTKPVFRLAVVGVEFDDVKHNSKISLKEWEAALFSKGTYTKKNATEQGVAGSLNDYFLEQSAGQFRVEGKVFDWVAVNKKRGDYSQGSGTSNRGQLPSDALAKLLAREGKDALKGFDGVFVIYAGASVRTNRGGVYYPHAGTLAVQGKRVPYLLSFEGGERMATLRTFCREFAYLLGLPDLAARTENLGSEGVGVWCLMGGPTEGLPQGLSAWSKEQLGWLKPTVVDPTVKQKLILPPIGSATRPCIKVLVRPDGSEYFLLENRPRQGSDSALPGEGLLIWRVVGGRPVLEESHGIEGATGARSLPELTPYPSKANNAFTPHTTPSSRSARGGGLPVHVTEIRRLADGRITFHLGYEYQ